MFQITRSGPFDVAIWPANFLPEMFWPQWRRVNFHNFAITWGKFGWPNLPICEFHLWLITWTKMAKNNFRFINFTLSLTALHILCYSWSKTYAELYVYCSTVQKDDPWRPFRKFPWDQPSAENYTLCSIYSPRWHLWCAKNPAVAPFMCLGWWQIPLGSASGNLPPPSVNLADPIYLGQWYSYLAHSLSLYLDYNF